MVVGGAFLVPGGDAPTLLEPVEQALHPVALAVGLLVEARPAALVGLGRDHRPDTAPAQGCAHRLAGVALVARQAARAQPWAPAPGALDGAPARQRRQRDLVVALARSQDEDDRLAVPLGPDVDLRTDPAPGAAERFGRWVPPFAPAAC
jgi:hypothetical protein